MSIVDIEDLQRWVGRSVESNQRIDAFAVRALAHLLDRDEVPVDGDMLPTAWHWLFFNDTPKPGEIGPDGHPKRGGFLPPVPLPRRMWAAGDITVVEPLIVGERTRKVSTIRSVESKEGKSGALVFVNVEHALEQASGGRVVEIQNLVYRDMPTGGAAPSPGASADANAAVAPDWSIPVAADSALLFRYSALTYNGHRIHHDREYAMREEHYPGLVVHGPLLATLLLESLHRSLPGAKVKRFRFRAVRPAFDHEPLVLCGKRGAGDAVELWTTSGPAGLVGMSASAVLA